MNFDIQELREAVLRLVADVPGAVSRAYDGADTDLQSMMDGQGGWNIPAVLRTAATCALVKGLPSDHPDVQFVRGALANYGYVAAAAV